MYPPGCLAQILGYLDFDFWMVPVYFYLDKHHPIVEITKHDTDSKPTEVKITCIHTMVKLSQASMSSNISKYSFQNLYVHCNISEPVYMGLQMAKHILMHRVDIDKRIMEDIFIPHSIFYQLCPCFHERLLPWFCFYFTEVKFLAV